LKVEKGLWVKESSGVQKWTSDGGAHVKKGLRGVEQNKGTRGGWGGVGGRKNNRTEMSINVCGGRTRIQRDLPKEKKTSKERKERHPFR